MPSKSVFSVCKVHNYEVVYFLLKRAEFWTYIMPNIFIQIKIVEYFFQIYLGTSRQRSDDADAEP